MGVLRKQDRQKDRLRLKPQIDKIEIDEKIGTRLRRNTARVF